MNSVSVIITSSHEPQTIGKALQAILAQDSPEIKEILVVSPDEQTLKAAATLSDPELTEGESKGKVKLIKDSGRGKPTALNLALSLSKGEILVLTDGDIYVSDNALNHLLAPFGAAQDKPFSNSKVGGTCGRPIPTNSRSTMLGFWSHFLTDSAHQIRLSRLQKSQFIELSGYLLAIRKKLVTTIPPETLADDSYLSHLVAKDGFKTIYTPEAEVFVKYPTTLSDWFKQKRRSAFEYWQNSYGSGKSMRSPLKEALLGSKFALTYPKNLKEVFWLLILFFCRLLLWLQIFFIKLTGTEKNLWVRVKTTK